MANNSDLRFDFLDDKAFLLPSLERVLQLPRKEPQVDILILSPSRELAIQTAEQASILTHAHGGDVTSMAMIGGTIVNFDMPKLKREGVPTILVATPGRLLGHLKSSYHGDAPFSSLFKNLHVLVIDEADVMLSLGFRDTILEILSYCPPPGKRQTLLFSATLEEAAELAQHATKAEYTLIDCVNSGGEDAAPEKSIPIGVKQSYAFVPLSRLFSAPIEIIVNLMENSRRRYTRKRRSRRKIIAFFPTIKQVKLYEDIFNNHLGRRVFAIHSDLGQNARTSARNLFQRALNAVLLTTDASARGVDYKDITHVIQFGIANDRKTYIHRLGRTGRAGKTGNGLLVLTDLERPFIEQSLEGLGLDQNAVFQSLLDAPMHPFLDDEISRMVAEIRDGKRGQLKRRIYEACDSIEAFYKTRQADLKESSGAGTKIDVDLLALTNSLLNQAGILSRFRTRVTANQAWIPGEGFDVGLSISRHRDNQHRRHTDSRGEDAVSNETGQMDGEINELGAHNANSGASVSQKRPNIPENSTTEDGGTLQASDSTKGSFQKTKRSPTKSGKIATAKQKAAVMKSTVDASFVEGPYYDWFRKRHPRNDDSE